MNIEEHIDEEQYENVSGAESALESRNEEPFVEWVEHDLVSYDPEKSSEPDGPVVETTLGLAVHPDNWDGNQALPVFDMMGEYGYDGPDGSVHHGIDLFGSQVTLTNYYEL
jgi:hypothetical protein